jgi:hypothetical protein
MQKPGLALLIISTVVACAQVSPVIPTGNNSYMISVVSHSQFSEAMVKATTDANTYCTSLGKKVVINHMDTAGTQFMSSSSARVQFSCYNENDPEYRQSVLRRDDGIN